MTEPISAGYTTQTYWLRLRLNRSDIAPARWWLALDRGYLDDVRLYHRRPDGRVDPERRSGDRVDQKGAIDYRAPAFELDLTETGMHEVYLRVRTHSSMVLQPWLVPAGEALHRVLVDYFGKGLYFGACLALLVLTLALAGWVPLRLYLPYLLLALSSTFTWWAVSGMAQDLSFNHRPLAADRLIAASIALSSSVGTMFYAELLALRRRTPRIWRVSVVLAAVLALTAVGPFVGLESRLTPLVLILMLSGPLLFVPAARIAWSEGAPVDRWACASVLLYEVLAGWNVLLAKGFINPGPWTDASGPMGNLMHVLSLTLLVGARASDSALLHRQAEERAELAEVERKRAHRAFEDQNHLLSMIAHEFRTPVAIIDASLQSLRLLDPDATPQRASRHQRIARAVERMTDVLDLALTRDRLDVSVWQQTFAPVNLAQITRDAIDAHGPVAERSVRLQALPALPTLQADSRMLRYALLNLIDNALKYSPRDKPVDISIVAAVHEGRDGLLWTILDQGRGVTAAQSERIFEKYFRAGENAEVPGIGLGLYLVRQILTRHQGWIRAVVAEPGNGGCFECWLPIKQRAAEGAAT